MEERHAKVRQKLEDLDKQSGATVTWDEAEKTQPATSSTTVKWE